MQATQRTAVQQLEQFLQTLPRILSLVDETVGHFRFPIGNCRFEYVLGTLCFVLCTNLRSWVLQVNRTNSKNQEQSTKLKVLNGINANRQPTIGNRQCFGRVCTK